MPDRIITKPSTKAYREGWELAFGEGQMPDNSLFSNEPGLLVEISHDGVIINAR